MCSLRESTVGLPWRAIQRRIKPSLRSGYAAASTNPKSSGSERRPVLEPRRTSSSSFDYFGNG